MSNRLEEVKSGNHIIAIYKDQETKFDEAFKFLKIGLDNNEMIMIITDSISKDKIRRKMENDWNVKTGLLESSNIINIKTTQEWYYSHGFPDPFKIKAFWFAMTEIARIRGKNGLRVFADTHDFFEKGFGNDLINYESTLDSNFDFQFTVICAYDTKDVQGLSQSQREILVSHHNRVWKDSK